MQSIVTFKTIVYKYTQYGRQLKLVQILMCFVFETPTISEVQALLDYKFFLKFKIIRI